MLRPSDLFAVAGGGDVECDVVAGRDGPVGVDERGMPAQFGVVGLVRSASYP